MFAKGFSLSKSCKYTSTWCCIDAVLLSRTTPATIYTIAHTGVMLVFGQKRTKVIAALAVI